MKTKANIPRIPRPATLVIELQSLPDKPFRVLVVILEERRAFGRLDFRITPASGSGEAWVSSASVE